MGKKLSGWKMQSVGRAAQAGFTLIELIIGLSVITMIILATGVFSFNGTQSKATNIMSLMSDLGGAALRYNAHTGMMPNKPKGLFDNSAITAADTFQGVAATSAWKGPYVNGFGSDANGAYKLDAYVAGAIIGFAKVTAGLPGGTSTGYQAVASGLPNEIVLQLAADCNGTAVLAAPPADHSNGEKCSGAVDSPSAGIGEVRYLFSSL